MLSYTCAVCVLWCNLCIGVYCMLASVIHHLKLIGLQVGHGQWSPVRANSSTFTHTWIITLLLCCVTLFGISPPSLPCGSTSFSLALGFIVFVVTFTISNEPMVQCYGCQGKCGRVRLVAAWVASRAGQCQPPIATYSAPFSIQSVQLQPNSKLKVVFDTDLWKG